MGYVFLKVVIFGLLFINLLFLVYIILNSVLQKSKNNRQYYDEAIVKIKLNRVLNKKRSYKDKISLLIIKSNINKFFQGINTNLILILCFVFGLSAFFVSFKVFNNILASIIFFIAIGLIPIYILEIMANYYSTKIDRNFMYFLNILSNFAQLKDDVYFSFQKSLGYVEEPLQSYCKSFVEEVKRGMPIEEGLDNFKDKLDNSRFKMFLNNAQLCTKYGGSFLKLAKNNLEIVKQLEIEKARRKSETALGRGLIYVMMGLNIVLGFYMFNLYPDTIERIRSDFYGQVVILINTINLFITFYLSLKLQKIDI